MFGLTKEVGRTHFSVNGFIRNHHRFGWTRKQVDTDTPKQLTLGFCHERIPRPDKQVNRVNRFSTNRHCTHGLNAAEYINFMRTTKVHCGNHSWVRLAIKWWSAGDNARYTRNFGSCNRHMR